MCSRRGSVSSSSASIPAASPRLRARTLPTRGTTSGGCSSLLDERVGVTNAAYRTTPGSGDLRRSDFDGSAERLARIADELRSGWFGFVGKEAYRGTFNERPELGVQARTLGETRLFVLPSTSPANAAVPWAERLRWFAELRALV
jgi:TDG/mug DNA glycosylase family protein